MPTRSMIVPEQRVTSGLQVRDSSEVDPLGFTGYASLFDSSYTVTDMFGEFTETIKNGAFTKTLAEQDDVRLLLNHDGLPLARTKSGTLQLTQDNTGLHVDATLAADSSLVQDIESAMRRGDLDQMSFAFQVVRQEWNEDYTDRLISEAKLFDVSVVTYPANPATSASIRAAVAARKGTSAVNELTSQIRQGALDSQARNILLTALGEETDEPERPDLAGQFRAAYLAART